MVHALHSRRHSLIVATLFLIGLALTLLTVRPVNGAYPPDFADLAEKLSPTVVNIYTTQTVEVSSSPHQFFFPDEMFHHRLIGFR